MQALHAIPTAPLLRLRRLCPIGSWSIGSHPLHTKAIHKKERSFVGTKLFTEPAIPLSLEDSEMWVTNYRHGQLRRGMGTGQLRRGMGSYQEELVATQRNGQLRRGTGSYVEERVAKQRNGRLCKGMGSTGWPKLIARPLAIRQFSLVRIQPTKKSLIDAVIKDQKTHSSHTCNDKKHIFTLQYPVCIYVRLLHSMQYIRYFEIQLTSYQTARNLVRPNICRLCASPTSAALFPIKWLTSDSLVHRQIDSRLQTEPASRVCPQGRIISVDCRCCVKGKFG